MQSSHCDTRLVPSPNTKSPETLLQISTLCSSSSAQSQPLQPLCGISMWVPLWKLLSPDPVDILALPPPPPTPCPLPPPTETSPWPLPSCSPLPWLPLRLVPPSAENPPIWVSYFSPKRPVPHFQPPTGHWDPDVCLSARFHQYHVPGRALGR